MVASGFWMRLVKAASQRAASAPSIARWSTESVQRMTVATSYAVGDYFSLRHSLHRRWREARTFHRTYAASVLVAAAVVLIPQVPLGLAHLGLVVLRCYLLAAIAVLAARAIQIALGGG
jgi:hypothetical protein